MRRGWTLEILLLFANMDDWRDVFTKCLSGLRREGRINFRKVVSISSCPQDVELLSEATS